MFSRHINKILKIQLFKSSAFSMATNNYCMDVKTIFKAAVKSVQTGNLIEKAVKVNSNYIEIEGKRFHLSKNAHIVGFGKAVLGMAIALEAKLKEHLVSGIVSIPEGTIKPPIKGQGVNYKEGSRIHVYEGAANNIPDENSLLAASKISDFVKSLKESDLLLVLISGGGSALLPAPKPPLTLQEKQEVTKLLARNGATINDLNAVRKRLSLLKGGKLAILAKPAKVASLILSDVIGDPLHFIASAPTVENKDDPQLPLQIIEKYGLRDKIPKSALQLLEDISSEPKNEEDFSHVSNFIVGNNQIALNAAAQCSEELNYMPVIITRELCGIARSVGEKLILLVIAALEDEIATANRLCSELLLQTESRQLLLNSIERSKQQGKKLCILFGGETTVNLQGMGIGGRNQELALSAAITLSMQKPKYDIYLLSGGTDGIDGPTPAAGAIATASTLEVATSEKLPPLEFLSNNDSYSFYSQVNNGSWLVNLGHTGTNVMDIIIILIKNHTAECTQ